jgi:hypothetical protein
MASMTYPQLNALAATLAEGKYVVMAKDGVTPYFFEIKKVKGGNRIYRLIGHPGDYARHTLNVKWQSYVLYVISQNPKQAITLYGKHAHFCGACDSPLTHDRSRKCGMGPKCAPQWGVKW